MTFFDFVPASNGTASDVPYRLEADCYDNFEKDSRYYAAWKINEHFAKDRIFDRASWRATNCISTPPIFSEGLRSIGFRLGSPARSRESKLINVAGIAPWSGSAPISTIVSFQVANGALMSPAPNASMKIPSQRCLTQTRMLGLVDVAGSGSQVRPPGPFTRAGMPHA
jgi:hypothetical protein